MAALIGAAVALGGVIVMFLRRRSRSGEAAASVRGDKPGRDRG